MSKKVETSPILGPTSYLAVEPGHRLHVVIEHFRSSFQHTIDRGQVAEKIGSQYFDNRSGAIANGMNTAMEMVGSAVG
jgi:hypothetical protein